jgi:hypothetical protein
MAEVDRLFGEYIEQHLAGARPNPRDFTDQLAGEQREELVDLIDLYLLDAPSEPWDATAFRDSPEARALEGFERALRGQAGLLPGILPRLRDRAKLRRDQVVAALAEKVGASGKEDKVAAYYHQLEFGDLPATGVKKQVFEALGSILGVSGAALRRAGESLAPSGGTGEEEAVHARFARPDEEYVSESIDQSSPDLVLKERAWDEVDELFRGAGRG